MQEREQVSLVLVPLQTVVKRRSDAVQWRANFCPQFTKVTPCRSTASDHMEAAFHKKVYVSDWLKTQQCAPVVGQSGITRCARPSPLISTDSYVSTTDLYAPMWSEVVLYIEGLYNLTMNIFIKDALCICRGLTLHILSLILLKCSAFNIK